MTGTEIYKQVGQRIYEKNRVKRQELNMEKQRLEGIELMTTEDKQDTEQQIMKLQTDRQQADERRAAAQAMIDWLGRKSNLEQQLRDKQVQLNGKRHDDQSDEQQRQRLLVKRWHDTATARQQLSTKAIEQKAIDELEQQKSDMQQRYDELCAAYRALLADIEAKERRRKAIETELEREKPNRTVYHAIDEIVNLHKQRCQTSYKIAEAHEDIAKDKAKLPVKEKEEQQADDKLKTLQTELTKWLHEREELHEDEAARRKERLSATVAALSLLSERLTASNKADQQLQSTKHELNQQQEQWQRAQAQLEVCQAAHEEAAKRYDEQKDWNALLAKAHDELHQGDRCPICGNVIEQLIPCGEQRLDEFEKRANKALADLTEAKAAVSTAKRLIQNLERDQQSQTKEADVAREACDRQWKQVQRLATPGDMALESMPNQEQIDKCTAKLQQDIEAANKVIGQARQLARQADDKRQQVDAARTAHQAAADAIFKIKESIKAQEAALQIQQEQLAIHGKRLDELLGETDWREQMKRDEHCISTLHKRANEYAKLEQEGIDLQRQLSEQRGACQAIEHSLRDTGDCGLVDHEHDGAKLIPRLGEQARRLERQCQQWYKDYAGHQQTLTDATESIKAFMSDHPDIDATLLEQLNAYQQPAIERIEAAQRQLQDDIRSLEGEVKALTDQQHVLAAEKPEGTDEDLERLQTAVNEARSQWESFNQQHIELSTRLRQNAEKERQHAAVVTTIERLQQESNEWATLNNYLGDAEGNKLRTIAQSYILHDLLNHANQYLLRFNARYSLTCKPDSLTILVRDTVQGDLSSVNTLSGGEGFMVSLSLALALAGTGLTGDMFSMDTIFIDEGFDTLSADYLDQVMETLSHLNTMAHRRIGIISHVELLRERLPVQVHVVSDRQDPTASRVKVVSL